MGGPPAPERAELDTVRHLGRRFPEARVREVPLVRAAELDLRADPTGSTRVWLALEQLQVAGSVKIRGALVAMSAAMARRASRGSAGDAPPCIVAGGSDNHARAVAYAACVLGANATVVLPRTASESARHHVRRYGAELVVAATDDWEDAEALAKELAITQGASYIGCTDEIEAALGNGASVGFEIVRALGGVPERVIAPFGGGSLATGLAWALAAETRAPHERSVWGVQHDAACTFALSLERDRAVEAVPSSGGASGCPLARGLSPEAFARARAALAGAVVVDEGQVDAAGSHARCEMGLVLERSAAVALAPVLFGLPEPLRGGDLVAVLTGRNVRTLERSESSDGTPAVRTLERSESSDGTPAVRTLERSESSDGTPE
ncbi:MAG TPA: pyridoxal-phosphate dependent enzyme [Polyangiaceae bacterium]|nr:pyridoxal-phosphate dependent enzyme [Polyangiaceae bacterium]